MPKTKVFISWSGPRSQYVAEKLRDWIPQMFHAIEPFFSTVSINPGTRPLSAIDRALSGSAMGLFCITPENAGSQWLNFEAGALARIVDDEEHLVIPLLIDFDSRASLRGPLTAFQNLEFITLNNEGKFQLHRESLLRVAEALNSILADEDMRTEAQIIATFDLLWEGIRSEIVDMPPVEDSGVSQDGPTETAEMINMIEELVANVRDIRRSQEKAPTNFTNINRSGHKVTTSDSFGEIMWSSADRFSDSSIFDPSDVYSSVPTGLTPPVKAGFDATKRVFRIFGDYSNVDTELLDEWASNLRPFSSVYKRIYFMNLDETIVHKSLLMP